ncbi:hypothetical protein ACFFX0_19660 [Citricoccus parietis]|uniref:Uncharacterized protein n=1 Tax=Citricoccus parietis TaxID=592307 RepID=A0ABV5G2X9_9MICC
MARVGGFGGGLGLAGGGHPVLGEDGGPRGLDLQQVEQVVRVRGLEHCGGAGGQGVQQAGVGLHGQRRQPRHSGQPGQTN